MKREICIILFFLASLPIFSQTDKNPASQADDKKAVQNSIIYNKQITQYSTISALSAGIYDSNFEIAQLKKYGDTGIGTYENLDGEMIYLNNEFFQIKVDGSAFQINDNARTPFATVCFFKQDTEIPLKSGMTFTDVVKEIENLIPSKNAMYSFIIDAKFKTMITRSVPPQEVPYPSLSEVIKTKQKTRKVLRMRGNVVGFYFPGYMKELNVAGVHMHFLTADKKTGGHVLDFVVDNGTLRISEKKDFFMILPGIESFRKYDFQSASKTAIQDEKKKEEPKTE